MPVIVEFQYPDLRVSDTCTYSTNRKRFTPENITDITSVFTIPIKPKFAHRLSVIIPC